MFESIKIYIGLQVQPEEIIKRLHKYGYNRVDKAAEQGDYARRGGVLDIYIAGFDDPVRIEFDNDKVSSIRSFDIAYLDYTDFHEILILLPIAGISPKKLKTRITGLGEEVPINNFVDINPSDFVVHVEYGIGRYLGIQKLKVDKKFTDHIVVEYADCDKLYLPVEEMHLIQKYIGFEGRPPRLNKLGSRRWKAMKAQAADGVRSLARELLSTQARRNAFSGFAFSADTEWQKQLEDGFPFKETPDQLHCISDVKKDMEAPRPMDRLLCGDVGYGKTEVALRAAFKAVMDGKQAAILVPTTILAEQHYTTFKRRLESFPVNVEMLSRFRTKLQQKMVIDGVAGGSVDIVIGTHRLLSRDIKFKDLGLLIIDEEQRFGVRHKERLKKLKTSVDVLAMTATPIPRTLYMSLMGAKDMSVLNTPPPNRLPIKTRVLTFNEQAVAKVIKNEIDRGGQVFFVHNRIEGIDKLTLALKRLLPDVNISMAHGQMPANQLERVMVDFIKNRAQVLVSTNIVESGIDIPNANTILINRADMFGLADLYQLRGRVGRFRQKAYAYFLISSREILQADAKKRLRAVARFTELGSGFKIAMEDLQLRGAGNLLGPQQHGYITLVGFDLYCRLLREAVKELA